MFEIANKINTVNLTDIKKDFIHGTHLDIFGNDFKTDIDPVKYFIHIYNEVPYAYVVYNNINLKHFIRILTEKYNLTQQNYVQKIEFARNKKASKIDWEGSYYFIHLKEQVFMEVSSYKIAFVYSPGIDLSSFNDIFVMIKQSKKKKKYNKKFFMVATSAHSDSGYELSKYNVKKQAVNLEENYNNDFLEINNVITNFLKDDSKNGLVLLHGKFGTGKTTYLRHIMSFVNKRFIFLPLTLMETLNTPNFLPFISKFKDSILILEDCEDLLVPRTQKSGNNNSLVNLLNLGDGLLSDALSLKIICTFNADLKQIDQAILRKGRLIAQYEFKELDAEKAKLLSEKLGHSMEIGKPMTLAELYNQKAKDFSQNNSKKIGFLSNS
jgi:DNA replication protein DnaC